MVANGHYVGKDKNGDTVMTSARQELFRKIVAEQTEALKRVTLGPGIYRVENHPSNITVVSIVETGKSVWRVSFDGKARGDSRGFDKQAAWDEAVKAVADETRWATRDGREIELALGTYPA